MVYNLHKSTVVRQFASLASAKAVCAKSLWGKHHGNFMSLLARMTRFWQRIVEPLHPLASPEIRNDARILAGMCLAILGISGAGIVLTIGTYRFDEISRLLPVLGSISFYLIPYYLCRRGYIRQAALLMTLMALLLIGTAALVMGQYSGQNLGQNILHYLVLVSLFSAAFLPINYTILFSVANIGMCIIYGIASPDVPFNEIVRGPLIYNGFAACFATLAAEFWRRRDAEKRTLLLTAEQQRHELIMRQERYTVLKTFIEATTHDFGTRLSQVETNRYFVRQKAKDSTVAPVIEPHLEKIRLVIRQMADQLNNLSMIANLDNPLRANVNLAIIIEKIAHEFSPIADKQQIHLYTTTETTLAYCDDVHIQLALHYLLDNALTYTPSGGTIRLRTGSTPTASLIIVEDTGKGIPADNLPHIFDAFYKGDAARTTTHSGLGLGLTVVRLIAEANQGTIEVTSLEGKGSTFTLALPHPIASPIAATSPS